MYDVSKEGNAFFNLRNFYDTFFLIQSDYAPGRHNQIFQIFVEH